MAKYDTADLLARVKRRLVRPATDEFFTISTTDDRHYGNMTDAQDRAFQDLMARVPDAMYGIPTAITSADSGASYTFGSGVFVVGHARIFSTLSDYPDSPLEEGVDYVYEGDAIRIPNNRTRTFPNGGPFAQWVTLPALIASGTEPTLITPARMLIVFGACEYGAQQLGEDSTVHAAEYGAELARLCLMFKTAVHPRISPYGRGSSGRITRSGGVVP